SPCLCGEHILIFTKINRRKLVNSRVIEIRIIRSLLQINHSKKITTDGSGTCTSVFVYHVYKTTTLCKWISISSNIQRILLVSKKCKLIKLLCCFIFSFAYIQIFVRQESTNNHDNCNANDG